jgi:steroid Delta-isomerase
MSADAGHLQALIEYFESLSPESVQELERFYARDAYFKDPFNEVRSAEEIRAIFSRMFRQLSQPRFSIREWTGDGRGYFLVWDLAFRSRWMRGGAAQVIHGASHLRFNAEGKVVYHRDYWDAAEELYAKLPLIGAVVRLLRRLSG